MKNRYKWLIIILTSIYVSIMAVPIHEAVHAYQCRNEGGVATFHIINSQGYDFLNASFLPALPSPAISCIGGIDENKGDWYYEAPAFFWAGLYQFGFIILFALAFVDYEKKQGTKAPKTIRQLLIL